MNKLFTTVLSLLQILFLNRINANSNAFCPDIAMEVFSLHTIEKHFTLIGTDNRSLSHLTSEDKLKVWIDVIRDPCVEDLTDNYDCLDILRNRSLQVYGQHNSELTESYRLYVNKEVSKPNEELQTMFEMNCLLACTALFYNRADNLAYFDYYCPEPCKLQTSCPKEMCNKFGMLIHQYNCSCPAGQVWDPEVYLCLNDELYDKRYKQKEVRPFLCTSYLLQFFL